MKISCQKQYVPIAFKAKKGSNVSKERLAFLLQQKKTNQEICEILEISKDELNRRLKLYDLQSAKSAILKEKQDEVMQLRSAGYTYAEISKIINTSKKSVYKANARIKKQAMATKNQEIKNLIKKEHELIDTIFKRLNLQEVVKNNLK